MFDLILMFCLIFSSAWQICLICLIIVLILFLIFPVVLKYFWISNKLAGLGVSRVCDVLLNTCISGFPTGRASYPQPCRYEPNSNFQNITIKQSFCDCLLVAQNDILCFFFCSISGFTINDLAAGSLDKGQ